MGLILGFLFASFCLITVGCILVGMVYAIVAAITGRE